MVKKLLILLCFIVLEQRADALAVTYSFSPNTLISSSQVNQNFSDIESIVNNLTAVNIADAAITAAKLNSDVVRTGYGVKLHTDGSLMVDVSDNYPGLELTDGGLRVSAYGAIQRTANGLEWGRAGDMLFTSNASVPDGFTDVSVTYNGKFIRISSSGLATGGSDTHDHGAATADHTLSIAEMPSHTHTYSKAYTSQDANQWNVIRDNNDGAYTTATSGSTGGDSGHSHGISTANNIPAYVAMYAYQKN